MNTQTHALAGLLVARLYPGSATWSQAQRTSIFAAALVGGFLPDLALYIMVPVELLLGTSMGEIWRHSYYNPPWSQFDAACNSAPLFAVLALVAWPLRWTWLMALAVAALVHISMDFLVHSSDGHMHFWPFSDWRFVSPLSYWEPGKGAFWITLVEAMLGLAACVWMFTQLKAIGWRVLLGLFAALYLATFALLVRWALYGPPFGG